MHSISKFAEDTAADFVMPERSNYVSNARFAHIKNGSITIVAKLNCSVVQQDLGRKRGHHFDFQKAQKESKTSSCTVSIFDAFSLSNSESEKDINKYIGKAISAPLHALYLFPLCVLWASF